MSPKRWIKAAAFVVTLLALAAAVETLGLRDFLHTDWIDDNIRGRSALGVWLFIGAGAFWTAVGLPRQIVGFFGGYAFGVAAGSGFAVIASAAGCVAAFMYARILGREIVRRYFPGRVKKLDSFLAENPFSMTVLIRFLPVGNNLATNLAAGVSSVPAFKFFAGSAVGYIPQTVIFALAGAGTELGDGAHITLAALLFIAAAAIGVYLVKKTRRARLLAEDTEDADAAAPAGNPAP
ncbi:MAG: TVP38/TMEM64 family protein [Rhodospirillales bacterium]